MLKVLELFGGIGAPRKALQRLGIEHEVVDYVEIDKYAVKSYNAIYGTNYEPQDITEWNKNLDVDLIFHGSPCQDFSIAGKGKGGEKDSGTRSSLLWETIRIVEKLKPKYVIWENVKAVISKKHKNIFDKYLRTMESLGYTNYYQVLNAKDYGIPQNRERIFTISILNSDQEFCFPQKKELKYKLKDLIEERVSGKYYLSEKMLAYCTDMTDRNGFVRGLRFNPYEVNNQKYAYTITSKSGTRPTDNFLKIKEATKKGYKEAYEGDSVNLEQPNSKTRRGRVGKQVAQTLTTSCNQGVIIDCKIRKLTPLECWRLMGFDDDDFVKAEQENSNTQLYKQAGNSIVVNVLEHIFNQLLK